MPFKYIDIKKRLLKLGFLIKRQKESHVLFVKGSIIFPVPRHGGKDISPGVENKILSILKINRKEFKNLI